MNSVWIHSQRMVSAAATTGLLLLNQVPDSSDCFDLATEETDCDVLPVVDAASSTDELGAFVMNHMTTAEDFP